MVISVSCKAKNYKYWGLLPWPSLLQKYCEDKETTMIASTQLQVHISGSCREKIIKKIQILRPVADSVAKMLQGWGGREDCWHTTDISKSCNEQFLKEIQILRPVAESVAKMLRGRGREDCRHTQVLLDILMRTDSSSNWGCTGRASPRRANTYYFCSMKWASSI